MEHLHALLSDLGLNKKETEIYLSLLTIGTAPASVLASRTRFMRSTTQYACQQLAKKQIIRKIQHGDAYLYSAEPPESLLALLDRERSTLNEKTRRTERLLGEFKDLMHPEIRLPRVQFCEGKEEMITLYKRILKLGEPIDSFEDKGEMVDFIPEYAQAFVTERKRRRIFNRVICPDSNVINVHSEAELRETRTLPASRYPFTWDVKICGDLVSIFSFERRTAMAVAIENADIAENFRLLFQRLWETTPDQ